MGVALPSGSIAGLEMPPSDTFGRLCSRTPPNGVSVCEVIARGVSSMLVPHLSRVAERELGALEERLSGVVLSGANDSQELIKC